MPPEPRPTEPRILHVDMDSFYVSVERLRDPALVGRPVAVGGSPDGRGVVASASYEARAFGVRSAMPMAKALRLCPELVVVSGSYTRYSEYARAVERILLEYSPLVQMASQDEAYVDLSGTERLWGPLPSVAHRIRERILAETELPASIGAASNKLVAKIASALSKPRGLLYVPSGSEEAFLRPLPIGRLPGIGPKARERLEEMGIRRLGQLANMPEKRLRSLFGSRGPEMALRARGLVHTPVVVGEPAKSISAEETFDADSADREHLESLLSNLAEKVAYRLRKASVRANTVSIKIRFDDFETHTVAESRAVPTDDESEVLAAARRLLYKRWDGIRPVRLLGVCSANLTSGAEQADLLAAAEDERRTRLNAAVDAARGKHGFGAIFRASSGGKAEEKRDRHWG